MSQAMSGIGTSRATVTWFAVMSGRRLSAVVTSAPYYELGIMRAAVDGGDTARESVRTARDTALSVLRDTWRATTYVMRRIRVEEWILAGLLLFCALICLASRTGFDF